MSRQNRISILTVDSRPLFREGIAAVIGSQPDMLLVAEATSGEDALQRFREHRPDITLMDLRLSDSSGIEVMIAILAHYPEARVIVVSSIEGDADIKRGMRSGARGCIHKSMHPREMIETIRQVHLETTSIAPLTAVPQAGQLGEGVTSTQFEVPAPAKKYMSRILRKLGARNRTSALTLAARQPHS